MTGVLRYQLPPTIAEAHLEIIRQARQADEAEQYIVDYPSEYEQRYNIEAEKNRMLRAENRSLKMALAEALSPPEEKLTQAEARLRKLEDGLRKLLDAT